MSQLEIVFNGYKLTDVMRITDVVRPIGNDRSVSLSDSAEFGSPLVGVKVSGKTIKVKFILQGQNIEELKHVLAKVFHTNSPAKLTFSDEPDKYYLAIVTGEIDLDNVKWWLQKGEITFFVPDGVAHSAAYRTYKTPTASGTKLTFDVVNNGNVPAYPIIEAVNTSDNGYLGFVCVEKEGQSEFPMSSMMEVGIREIVAQTIVKRSQVMFDYKDMTTALSRATARNAAVPGLSHTYNTSFEVVNTDNGTKRLKLNSSSGGEKAASLTWQIPQQEGVSMNERIAWNMTLYGASYINTRPSIGVYVSDDSGAFLYGLEYIKETAVDNYQLRLWALDGAGGSNLLKIWDFSGSVQNQPTYRFTKYHSIGGRRAGRTFFPPNPFGLDGGNISLVRNGRKLTVTLQGVNFTIQVPWLEGKQSSKLHLAMTYFDAEQRFRETVFGVNSLTYRKDFTAISREIPNRYQNGSVVMIDCEKDRIIVDGLDQTNDLVHGSDFLVIPPGQSTIEVYSSTFATSPPRVEVKFEERWL
ncbi:TPA: distal tail protein Dit [Streptococcus suis]